MTRKPKIIDLYSGCGGFGLGAEQAGFESAAAVDIDSTLQSAYNLNFPGTRVINADVSKLDKKFWDKVLGGNRIAGLIGGPPCQGFSRIGKKAVDDPRNSLVGHFYRHVKILQPKFFVMENVVGILDEGSWEYLEKALRQVPENYEVLPPVIVNAVDHGAPTKRRRVIVVGYDRTEVDSISCSDLTTPSAVTPVTVSEAIADLPTPLDDPMNSEDYGWSPYPKKASKPSAYAERMRAIPNHLGWEHAISQLMHGKISGILGTKHTKAVKDRFAKTTPGNTEPVSRYPRLKWDGQCPTLRAGTGRDRGSFQAMRPIHPAEPRVITVREAARLQGFPDWFVFHPSKWHSFRMIGNSVSPIVSKHILSTILGKMAS